MPLVHVNLSVEPLSWPYFIVIITCLVKKSQAHIRAEFQKRAKSEGNTYSFKVVKRLLLAQMYFESPDGSLAYVCLCQCVRNGL